MAFGYHLGPNGDAADGTFANGHLSLNGSVSYFSGNTNGAEIYVYATAGPVTAFGTNVGSLSPYGGDIPTATSLHPTTIR